MPPSLPFAEQRPPARAELLWLAAAILLGAILRLAYPGRMAIEHFDEGVYASNFWFGAEEGYEYPARHLYAPPLLPAVIEWTMIIASLCGVRPTGFVPMIPSLIAGLATIPSIWWVGRRWFGPSAGLVAAWLVAASDFHSSYTRTALTDVPVCLFILWGVYFIWQALLTGTRRAIILAALFTALAWWTKYNGWLPLAVGLSGAILWQVTLPRTERQLLQVAKRWLLVAGLSFLFWSPVLIGLQKYGGYGAVAANHRQYVVGFNGWRSAANEQLDHVVFYDNLLPQTDDSAPTHRIYQAIQSVIPFPLGWLTPLLLMTGTIVGCLAWCIHHRKSRAAVAGWMLLSWVCGLSLAVPCYHPYPRLVLPWLIAIWLGAGLVLQILINSGCLFALKAGALSDRWKPQWLDLIVVIWVLAGVTIRCQFGTARAWENRARMAATMKDVAGQIKNHTTENGFPRDESIVYVFGAPALVFHLKANGLQLVAPIQNFDFMNTPHPRPTFLVRLGRAQRDPSFQADLEIKKTNFVLMRIFDESKIVRLDERSGVGSNSATLWVGRIRD